MKQIFKIAGGVAILFLMSIAPYLSENLVPEAQALRGRGAAFAVGAAVGSAGSGPGSAPAPAPAPAPVIINVPPPAPAPAAAPPPPAKRIINITSRGAFRGEPDAPAYGASKAGMNAMSQSFAKALAPQNVLVFAVAPGWIDTDMAAPSVNGPDSASIAAQSPLNRLGTPEEIAAIVLWLATDAPAFMTGAILDANGASYLRT